MTMKTLLALLLLCFNTAAYAGWTPGVWPASEPTNSWYRNSQGNDLLTNTLVRARSLNDYDWNVVNQVTVAAEEDVNGVVTAWDTINVTNLYGPFTQAGTSVTYRGSVSLRAASLETLSRKTESMLNSYTLAAYSEPTNAYSFDLWFSTAVPESRRDNFPVCTKPDLFYHAGLGGFTNLQTYEVMPGTYMATNTDAFWLKRTNWFNSTILGVWSSVDGVGGAFGDYVVYLSGGLDTLYAVNEFTAGYTTLIGIDGLYPVFKLTPGGTNAYDDQAYLYSDAALYWTNNRFEEWHGDEVVEPVVDGAPALRPYAGYAYTLLRPDTASAFPNAGDYVELRWATNMNAYEGTKIWDNILRAEQLDEYHVALTNLFLTPWTDWGWADGTLRTNRMDLTNALIANIPLTLGDIFFDASTNCAVSNGVNSCEDLDPREGVLGLDWWLANDPIPWYRLAEAVEGAYVPVDGGTTSVTGDPPVFAFSVAIDATAKQEMTATTGTIAPYPAGEWPTGAEWSVSAYHQTSNYTARVEGISVIARMAATNLNTSIGHRAHFYLRYDYEQASNSTPWYHRIATVPEEGFSYDPVLYGPYIDVSTNVVLPDLPTNAITSVRQDMICGSSLQGTWKTTYLDSTTTPLVVHYTQPAGSTNETFSSLTYMTNSVTTNDTLYPPYYFVGYLIDVYSNYTGDIVWDAAESNLAEITWCMYARTICYTTNEVETCSFATNVNYSFYDVDCCEVHTNAASAITTNALTTYIEQPSLCYTNGDYVYSFYYKWYDVIDATGISTNYLTTGSPNQICNGPVILPYSYCPVDPGYPGMEGTYVDWPCDMDVISNDVAMAVFVACDDPNVANTFSASQLDSDIVDLNLNYEYSVDALILIEWDY